MYTFDRLLVILRWGMRRIVFLWGCSGYYFFSVPHRILWEAGRLFSGWCLWWHLPMPDRTQIFNTQVVGSPTGQLHAHEGWRILSALTLPFRHQGHQVGGLNRCLLIFWPVQQSSQEGVGKPRDVERLGCTLSGQAWLVGLSLGSQKITGLLHLEEPYLGIQNII